MVSGCRLQPGVQPRPRQRLCRLTACFFAGAAGLRHWATGPCLVLGGSNWLDSWPDQPHPSSRYLLNRDLPEKALPVQPIQRTKDLEDDNTIAAELAPRLARLRRTLSSETPRRATQRLWFLANKLSLAICGLVGARFALRLAATQDTVTLTTVAAATISALLTAFGGALQSKWLQYLASGGGSRPARAAGSGPQTACYVTVLSGVVLAVLLQCTGVLTSMEGRVFKFIVSTNMGICAGLAVIDWSGWRTAIIARYSKARGPIGSAMRRTRQWATGMSQRRAPPKRASLSLLASVPGTFLYMFGGGVWRDLLGRTSPVAFRVGTLVPASLGVILCALIYEFVDKRQCGTFVLIAGVPMASVLTAAWPF